MKKNIQMIFVLIWQYLGYIVSNSLPNMKVPKGIFLNSRNPSRGFGNCNKYYIYKKNLISRCMLYFSIAYLLFIYSRQNHACTFINSQRKSTNSCVR